MDNIKNSQRGAVGCGVIMFVVLLLIVVASFGAIKGIAYYEEHCQDLPIEECLSMINEAEAPPDKSDVTATGSYSLKGYTVNVVFHIPLSGGSVSGTASGACDGVVKGSYSGGDNGAISGKMTGACSPFIVPIPAKATFQGTVNKESKTVPIGFSGSGGGLNHSGSLTLSY